MNPTNSTLAPCIAVLGTGSDVGKSVIAAALCRLFVRRGRRVAPFKAQNMSNNSGVTPEGLEMGRAQIVQAEAARIAPQVDMNPVLLKPTSDLGAQVVVTGASYAEAFEACLARQRETGALLTHAYDQPEVVSGAGTLAREIEAQGRAGQTAPGAAPDTVLALIGLEVKKDAPLAKACARAGDVLVYEVAKRGRVAWVAERKDVLKIPNTALRYSPPDGAVYDGTPPQKLNRNQRLVYGTNADGAKLKPIIIKTGITDGADTEVAEGLKAGESVVTTTLTTSVKSGFGGPPPQVPQ